jgi:hydrogenase maturation protein HypF
LLGDYRRFERCGWLRPAPLIGGDRAQAEPWRNALVRLDQAGLGDWADRAFAAQPLEMARMAAEKGLNAPLSSSAGRLFDAVAAILGICPEGQSYEGEAAMRLEAMATRAGGGPEWAVPDGPEIDPSEMIRALVAAMQEGVGPERLAWAFHDWLARAFAAQARDLVESGAAKAVALSGGCFQNALLLTLTRKALGDLPVMVHERTPANDGGLALGQAVSAAAKATLG